jgi:hypothetical protein
MKVQEALAAVRDNQPHRLTPLPWSQEDPPGERVVAGDRSFAADCSTDEDAAHIAAAVNAAPVLAVEVERLQGLLAAARVAVAELPEYYHEASCGHGDCCCPAEYGETKRTAARRKVGLEERK